MSLFPLFCPRDWPRVRFIGNQEGGTGSPTSVTASFGTGGANGDMLVIGMAWNNGSATSGLTVAGAAATLVAEDSGGSNPDQARAVLYRIAAPSASSGTVSFSYVGAAPGSAGTTIAVWRVKGLDSQAPFVTNTAATGQDNVPNGTVLIGVHSFDNSGGSTFAGAVEDFDTSLHSGASEDDIEADTTYDYSISGPGGSAANAWALWR